MIVKKSMLSFSKKIFVLRVVVSYKVVEQISVCTYVVVVLCGPKASATEPIFLKIPHNLYIFKTE